MRRLSPALVCFTLLVAFSVWAYPRLPPRVPIHWGLDGRPDGWSTPLVATVVAPVILAGLGLLFTVLPRIDPRRESYIRHQRAYWQLVNGILIAVAGVQLLVVGSGLGWNVNVGMGVALLVGGLFVYLGILLPRMEANWFVGIRTPWTLSSDRVWRETHRVGAGGFIVLGLLVMALGVIQTAWLLYVTLAFGLLWGGGIMWYSWKLWKREREGQAPGGPVSSRSAPRP